MQELFSAAGYGRDKISLTTSVVRGLEYYTGPVFEIELTFTVQNEKGQDVVFGSVGGGGRYDGLVSRFRNEATPATVLVAVPAAKGSLAAAAGVLALHSLEVHAAELSTTGEVAVFRFTVSPRFGGLPDPALLRTDLGRVVDGTLVLADALARKERDYAPTNSSEPPAPPRRCSSAEPSRERSPGRTRVPSRPAGSRPGENRRGTKPAPRTQAEPRRPTEPAAEVAAGRARPRPSPSRS